MKTGTFGAAPPAQQVSCDLQPSRLSVCPSFSQQRHQEGWKAPARLPNHNRVAGPLMQSWSGKGAKRFLGRKAQISQVSLPPASTPEEVLRN